MQNDPVKTVDNYNEFLGTRNPRDPIGGSFGLWLEVVEMSEQQHIIEVGRELVNAKADEILGAGNRLTRDDIALPTTRFIDTDPNYPTWAGYYSASRNEIVVMAGKVTDRQGRLKVFIHEYVHFLSHNGRDLGEQITETSPLARNNNVGFHRDFGLDIREGKEGERTRDYFIAFNEAVTEQLAIDILPGAYETYDDYRGLLAQVIDDVVTRGLGTKDETGTFNAWSKDQVKNYIYRCFFKGDLDGFTQLLQMTYQKYEISEQQFGLMTHKDDLPSVIDNDWRINNPGSPPPSPTQVGAMVQKRLDTKTPEDYETDVFDPEPGDEYGLEYDTHIQDSLLTISHQELIGGTQFDIDNLGYVVYRGEDAAIVLSKVYEELDILLRVAKQGEISAEDVAERMDHLLFETYAISMLSDGFRQFYVYKHTEIDKL
jgi:hypothetical protein